LRICGFERRTKPTAPSSPSHLAARLEVSSPAQKGMSSAMLQSGRLEKLLGSFAGSCSAMTVCFGDAAFVTIAGRGGADACSVPEATSFVERPSRPLRIGESTRSSSLRVPGGSRLRLVLEVLLWRLVAVALPAGSATPPKELTLPTGPLPVWARTDARGGREGRAGAAAVFAAGCACVWSVDRACEAGGTSCAGETE